MREPVWGKSWIERMWPYWWGLSLMEWLDLQLMGATEEQQVNAWRDLWQAEEEVRDE